MENIVEQIKEVISFEISNLRAEIKQDMDNLRAEVKQDMDNLRAEVKQDMDNLRTELTQKMENLSKEILDRQFVFEEKYGTKIDIAYEYILAEQEKNQEKFNRISELEKRTELSELRILDHEKRITFLKTKHKKI